MPTVDDPQNFSKREKQQNTPSLKTKSIDRIPTISPQNKKNLKNVNSANDVDSPRPIIIYDLKIAVMERSRKSAGKKRKKFKKLQQNQDISQTQVFDPSHHFSKTVRAYANAKVGSP